MSSLTPDDVIDLRDESLAAQLLPEAAFPLIHSHLTPEQCTLLSKNVFDRTKRVIDSVMHDMRSDQILLLILHRDQGDEAGEVDDEAVYARQIGISPGDADIGTWFHSHDGSREVNFETLLADGGAQPDGVSTQ